jgi:hypothetical protein
VAERRTYLLTSLVTVAFGVSLQESRSVGRRSDLTTIAITARYARYVLTSLATIAFGMNMQ